MGVTDPVFYGDRFYEIFLNAYKKNNAVQREVPNHQQPKNPEKKKAVAEKGAPDEDLKCSSIELEANSSKFGVFAAIRGAVLEAETKQSLVPAAGSKTILPIWYGCCMLCVACCKLGDSINCRCHSQRLQSGTFFVDNDSDDSDKTVDITQREMVQRVPQIVGAGLKSLFELISEAKQLHPNLCTKALKALLDVIQGQYPESFKSEPPELIDQLYDLLLDISTFNGHMGMDPDSKNWSAIACSALLGLCVARGDTGKMLKAIAAILMSPKQVIQLPVVLNILQRSVIAVALNRPTKPDIIKNGIPMNCLICSFSIEHQLPGGTEMPLNLQPSMASDGRYLYILVGKTLLKIGSGFNGTLKGDVYAVNNEFSKEVNGWLGYANNTLFYRKTSKKDFDNILVVNTETLKICGTLKTNRASSGDVCNLVFADGESLNAIYTTNDESLVVKQIDTSGASNFDLPLKLARKTFRTYGYAQFEAEVLNQSQIQKIASTFNAFEPKLSGGLELSSIACGKDFGLVRTTNGKVYYYGKASALGLKSVGKSPTLKLTELIISKVANIVHVSIGHDGIHALLVGDDGSVFFTGTARRNEDGDLSKTRRQPKATKPKKITRMDDQDGIVYCSSNNGTSAFVTKSGKLIMFGKDTSNCDSTGVVTDLSDQHITKVALGKAHCVALNSRGQLFTFGFNNKGQCGRPFTREKDSHLPLSMETSESKSLDGKNKTNGICDPDDHFIVVGICRICTVCKECTGFNIACVSTLNIPIDERIPGAKCACGPGCSGCSKCGACATCINYQDNDNLVDANNREESHFLDVLTRPKSNKSSSKKRDRKGAEETGNQSDIERDQPKFAPLSPQKLNLPTQSPVIQISCGLHHTVVLTQLREVFTFGSNQYGQLGTGDLQPVSGVVQVKIHGIPTQVAAGANHTILLNQKGVVYTFGSYLKGQLGRLPPDGQLGEDIFSSGSSNRNDKTYSANDILAHRQKYLWNCSPAAVQGIGSNSGKRATWIGGSGDQTFIRIDESLVSISMLSKVNVVADRNAIVLIPNTPLTFDCLAINRRDGSCNVHNINQTNFMKLIKSNQENCSRIESDKINKNVQPEQQAQGSYSYKKKKNNPEINSQLAFALESTYGNLWVFDGFSKNIYCYNVIASEMIDHFNNVTDMKAILTPELALPSSKTDSQVTRYQASMNLLACLDILTSASDAIPHCFEMASPVPFTLSKENQASDYQSVCRFENLGGGWGYTGHSVEAIRFMADTNIIIGGFGMYGGRGDYTCKLKLYDLGMDGGGYEKDGLLVAETEDIPFECPSRSKFSIMLPKPITASSGRWFLVWAKISGPSSDCGAAGQAVVTTDDQVVFTFKSSKKSNNSTGINSGQIPSILYKVVNVNKPLTGSDIEAVHKISKLFANSVSKECFDSLIALCKWSWNTFMGEKMNYSQSKSNLDRLLYISKACLRLLRKYTNEIYPLTPKRKTTERNPPVVHDFSEKRKTYNGSGASSSKSPSHSHVGLNMDLNTPTNKRVNSENILLAECVGSVRALLKDILCDEVGCESDLDYGAYGMYLDILEECHTTFVSCFNAFFPTSTLKWNILCELLSEADSGVLHGRYLSAVIAGLSSPNINLRKTFSLLTPQRDTKSIVSPSDNLGLPMLSSIENHIYPVLVEQMIYRTQQEKTEFQTNLWTFKDVLVKLLNLIAKPIELKVGNIRNQSAKYTQMEFETKIHQGLIDNCCHLLKRVLAEIVYQSCITEIDQNTPLVRSIQSTGSRYARVDTTRTWNTGNFGPDAIAFSVDKSGIAIAGAMIYSGSGTYDYQLELLQDTMDSKLTSQNRWDTLESTSGTYDQDAVQNDMVEIRFSHPIRVREHCRYAIRLCSQGAKTCFGDSGVSSLSGPCGVTFSFFPCDLSFNGTTPNRGQIPCLLYYSSPNKFPNQSGKMIGEIHARDIALNIASDIVKKCMELLVYVREILETGTETDKSGNSSNRHLIDSEHNITPIEEHLDVSWMTNANHESPLFKARDITKKLESFTKGIVETLKLDKSKTNPFECEIEIGATEISTNDLVNESDSGNGRRFRMSGVSEDGDDMRRYLNRGSQNDSDDDDDSDSPFNIGQIVDIFGYKEATMFHTLLPVVLALVGPLVNSDPKSSVHVLGLIRQFLPHVTALNRQFITKDISSMQILMKSVHEEQICNDFINENHGEAPSKVNYKADDKSMKMYELMNSGVMSTTSRHCCTVESDHPYKSASITTYRVVFPPCVQWFSIEFDPQCGTAQPEDYLTLSIPVHFSDQTGYLKTTEGKSPVNMRNIEASVCSLDDDNASTVVQQKLDSDDWIMIKKYNKSSNWDDKCIILPGNRLELSFETASNYLNDRQCNRFGFKCLVIGYDNPSVGQFTNSCLIRLEHELSYLAGSCCANLLKNKLVLPDDAADEIVTEDHEIDNHFNLLTKGLTLPETMLTINQALDSHLPIGNHSNERQFLKDFVTGAPGSAGARLAAWLQPESRLDPNKCELKISDESIYCGWPTELVVVIRDQYDDVVVVPDIKVEINVTPAETTVNGNRKSKRVSFLMADQGILPKVPYESTVKEKMNYNAITFMKAYDNFSFEELRYFEPNQSRVSESLLASDKKNGQFGCSWTPTATGGFCLTVVIDGLPLEEVHRVDVKETGVPPPPPKFAEKRIQPQATKLRKFIAKYSAGLRIRSHPTLQSAQVGVLSMNGIISFIDEIQNDDGIWVRLSTESIRQHCVATWFPTEAWCLQYNQHLNKKLLFPVIDGQLEESANDDDQDQSLPGSQSNEEASPDAQDLVQPQIDRQAKEKDVINNRNPFDEADSFESTEMTDLRKQSQSPNQSNLGSTIAVVVGEGANKLQQLHKWFKGDSVDLKTGIKKRGDELIGNRPELDGSPQSESCPSSPKLMANRRDPDSTSWTNGQELKRHTFVVATPTTPEISKCSRKFKTKRALGADSLSKTSSSKNSRNNSTEDYTALKRALPPALAESLRAVFAAFLWHEGIVHDAMACSSYLKFHPMIPKYGEASSEGTDDSSYVPMTKEEKAQQRHSVEVVNSDNYNVTTPYKSTLDTLAKSGYSSINNRRRTMQQEKTKLHSLPETTVLPPALKCLVFLWEQLSSKCVDLVQSKSFGADVQRDLFPIRPPRNKNEHIFDGIGKGTVFLEKEHRKTQSSKEDGSFCELCETYLIMPVTFHMRSHHSGCGKSSKGKGYNSVGTYCDGWAGNCGEGGKGATSWYLLCEKCRDNYLARQRKPHETKSRSESVYGLSASTKINTDVYRMIKENALFLLELSNNDNENYLQNQKKSPQSNAREFANPRFSNTSFNYNGNLIPMKQRSLFSGQGLDRKSTLSENIESPELLWPAPDIFSCFELLSSTTIDEPLEFGDQTFGPENFGQRPLSEVSFDYANGAENFAFGSQNTSKFHRSLSMGHGWMNSNSSNNKNNLGKKNFGKNDTALVTDSDKVVFRRKNRAACDDDTGSLLLCHPSNNLLNLVPKDALISSFSSSKDVDNCLNCLTTRPSMSFIFEQHNLDRLRAIMRRSLRVAICRIYSLQAFNWLMRTVTQTICLHDLMWFFVTSLNGPHWTEYDDNGMEREQALDHPVTSTKLSGQVSGVVSQSLHSFLQSVADLTLLLPPGSAVQQMAIQCFGMRFRQSDHQFLHRSHVFGNISKILSRSDEQSEDLKVSGNFPGIVSDTLQDIGCRIVQLIDLQGMFEVSVSSRPAMASALIDNSTETFWESDEEDRNKSKFIEISMLKLNYVCKQISIHIDNSRDIGNKVNSIIFYSGQSLGDMNLVKSIDFDGSTESGCWISAPIKDESATHFRIVLNGQDPTLRVRNIKLLGYSTCQPVKFNIKINNSIHMQQKNCEAATLKVFRLLTGQVFGKLILGQRDSTTPMERMEEAKDNGKGSNENSLLADSLDMREHMVGILFSRSKLSHLQKQVIVHIVHAIRKETQRARNEWEMQTNDGDQKSDSASENSRSTDTYCFEMLSMVLALSGSSVGRSYLSQQYGLLKDLLILLHVGSDRVQRQVTSLLRRILPEINPINFADLLGVMNMPPSDFGVVQQSAKEFDINEIGVMDIFLAVISKALHLQVKKMRANTGNQNKNIITVRLSQCLEITSDQLDGEAEGQIEEDVDQSSHSNDFELNRRTKDNPESGQRWFLKGRTSIKQAENMILFLRDICQGKLNEVWSQTIKAAIAEVVVNLTRLDGNNRSPESCLNTPTLWLALAGLCVLDKEHVEKLSSSQWSNNESRPLCSNHDDDVTTAVIQCNTCSFLCGDCDRFLHLNRKTRSHIRSVCKEEEEAIRVELHESCGRIKLFWLLALADSKTLNAMVEFRDGKNSIISQPPNFFGRCRFCGVSENSGLLAIGNVCADSQCQEYATFACVKVKLCGHICGGVANEQKCLPCLHQSCHNRENDTADLFREPKLTQDADDMCMICFTEALSAAPSCQLDCGHVFHYHCCKAVLLKRWTGPRISFGFCQCPICKADIQHELLNDILEPIRSLKNDVQRKAKMRLEYEGVLNQPSEMPEMIADAMDRYAYYVCFKCNKAYYGGEVRCDAEMGDKFNPEELVCGACSDVARAQMCPKHGTDFLEYKCRYCCSVAVFFCFGTTHFCDTCHDDFQRLTNIPKNKLPKCPAAPKAKQLYGEECPLHIVHPPTGEEFALGCGICRNAQTF